MSDLRLVPEGCPSRLALDRIALGELDDPAIVAHVESCAECAAVLREARAGFEALPELAARRDAIVARIHARQVPHVSTWARVRAWLTAGFAPALVAATALIFAIVALPSSELLRVKGGVKLRVFRERAGAVEELGAGDRARAGDRLRFRVEVPDGGWLMIVGVEEGGRVFAYYPLGAERATDQRAPELPDAIELDESEGPETIYLVWCEERFELSALGASGEVLSTPEGCRSNGFAFVKGP